MLDKITAIIKEINDYPSSGTNNIEQFKIRFLSKKGIITQLFGDFKSVPAEQKPLIGQKINEVKELAWKKYNELSQGDNNLREARLIVDPTVPGESLPLGSRHPVSLVRKEIIDIFLRLGFTISEGPEIEDDWHVFSALNFSQNHPARDMQDTLFIKKDPDIMLRTHTSSVQVRVMERYKPPIRTISPGRVFRNEAVSARSHCFFHQIEGLYIDEGVSFADLKQTLIFFAQEMFDKDIRVRLRPSYFPFTEPSAEMDISCSICDGKGCNVCKYSGWLEILGCGMVDPNVLELCNIDNTKYTGYAFGMGIDRIAMRKYQINDIRILFENDKRFLDQFISCI